MTQKGFAGQTGPVVDDLGDGVTHVPLADRPAGAFAHFNAATAGTTIKTGAGRLRKVVVNTPAAGSSVTLYDNTAASGAIIAVISTAAFLGEIEYDLPFSTGLEIVIAGGAPDITVVYR